MGKRSALLRVKLYPDLDSVQASAQPTRYKKQHHTSPHSYSHCHSVTFLSLTLPGNLPLQFFASAATRRSHRICDQRNQRTLAEDSLKLFYQDLSFLYIHNSVEIILHFIINEVLIEIDYKKYLFKLIVKYYLTFSRNNFLSPDLLQIIFSHFSKSL